MPIYDKALGFTIHVQVAYLWSENIYNHDMSACAW